MFIYKYIYIFIYLYACISMLSQYRLRGCFGIKMSAPQFWDSHCIDQTDPWLSEICNVNLRFRAKHQLRGVSLCWCRQAQVNILSFISC